MEQTNLFPDDDRLYFIRDLQTSYLIRYHTWYKMESGGVARIKVEIKGRKMISTIEYLGSREKEILETTSRKKIINAVSGFFNGIYSRLVEPEE